MRKRGYEQQSFWTNEISQGYFKKHGADMRKRGAKSKPKGPN